MKLQIKTKLIALLMAAAAAIAVVSVQQPLAVIASGGSGGGGQNPPPTVTVPTIDLSFDPSPVVNGVVPSCTGYYTVTPYWLGASKLDVNLDYRSLNEPSGTQLYVTVTMSTLQYGTISGYFTVLGQRGRCRINGLCLPWATLTSVVVKDAAGKVIFSGH